MYILKSKLEPELNSSPSYSNNRYFRIVYSVKNTEFFGISGLSINSILSLAIVVPKEIGELQGKLKVYVHAKGFDETEQMLRQFKEDLPSGASMAQLNIKTPKENDWFARFDALEQGKDLKSLSKTFDVDVLVYAEKHHNVHLYKNRQGLSHLLHCKRKLL
jgi:hypothetical protein